MRQLADLPPHAAELAAGHGPTLERIARLERVLEENRARPETSVPGIDQPVVFVCAEFGIHPSLPIYSGGLGALAGDILKQASDLALPMIGVGLLYRKGYFHQRVDRTGLQHEYWTQIMPERLPTVLVLDETGAPLRLSFSLFGREVAFHVWRAEIGRVPLYLLDTELEENDPVDRWITARLYEGNPLTRLGQYALLGLGTVRALHALGLLALHQRVVVGEEIERLDVRAPARSDRGPDRAHVVAEVRAAGGGDAGQDAALCAHAGRKAMTETRILARRRRSAGA